MRSVKVLVLGANGMLGGTLIRYFFSLPGFEVLGTARTINSVRNLPKDVQACIRLIFAVEKIDHLSEFLSDTNPDVVLNCIGVVKQSPQIEDASACILINSLFPHRLAKLCSAVGARLVHFSTDCVFSGAKGLYEENDAPDTRDLYGLTKLIGEVDYLNAITLRTSIIGHELSNHRSLVGWFLSQSGNVKGFRRAFFSGLPTVEIARVVHQFVLPNPLLRGLYHLSVDPINKFDLLTLVSDVYGKSIEIIPDDILKIDRSLDSSRFRRATGFTPKAWPELVQAMHDFE